MCFWKPHLSECCFVVTLKIKFKAIILWLTVHSNGASALMLLIYFEWVTSCVAALWIHQCCVTAIAHIRNFQLFACVSQSDRSMQITDNATQLRLCKTGEQRSMSLQTRLSSSVNAYAPCLCTVMFMVRSVIFRTHVGLNLPLWIFLMWRIMWIQIFAMGKKKRYWSSNVCFPCMANSGDFICVPLTERCRWCFQEVEGFRHEGLC